MQAPTEPSTGVRENSCVSCGENISAPPATVRELTCEEADELKSSPMAFFLGYGVEPMRLGVPRG